VNPTGESSTSRRRIQTERRERPFRWGIVACVVGLIVVVSGGLALNATQAAQVIGAGDRAEIPDELRFDAEARRYAIVLIRDPAAFGVPGDPVANLRCTVTLADGTTDLVEGNRQAISLETEVGESVGAFDGVEGDTTIACVFANSSNPELYYVAVAPDRASWAIAAYVMIAAGLLMSGIGVALVIIGVRGRMVIVDGASPA
jgi:hypothetical protein